MMRESLKLKRVLVNIMVVLMMAAYMSGMDNIFRRQPAAGRLLSARA